MICRRPTGARSKILPDNGIDPGLVNRIVLGHNCLLQQIDAHCAERPLAVVVIIVTTGAVAL